MGLIVIARPAAKSSIRPGSHRHSFDCGKNGVEHAVLGSVSGGAARRTLMMRIAAIT